MSMIEAMANEGTDSLAPRATADAAATHGVETLVLTGTNALAAYAAVADPLVHAPPQDARWIDAWRATVNDDIVCGFLKRDGRTLFALPLDVSRKGPFRVARFPGCSHANGNFAPTNRTEPPLRGDIERLIAAIGRARRDIDLVLLERLAPAMHGLDNPLLALPHRVSADIGLAVNLEGGFDGVMSRASGKRKRKKHRSQQRKFEATGVIEIARARTSAEIESLLDIFFAIKGERLRRLGVNDVFADAKIQRFFKRLFADAAESGSGAFVLERLSVGGKVRAVTGSSNSGDRTICEFSSFANDDLSYVSPGEYLFFEAIATACREGRSVFDFSVGDEHYKRLWCDIETAYADVALPLGFRGALLSASIGTKSALARRIKSSAWWPRIKKLRRREIEYRKPEDGDDDG